MKRVNTSQITFNDIRKTFAFTKVIWNGEVAWDDGYCNGDYDMFGLNEEEVNALQEELNQTAAKLKKVQTDLEIKQREMSDNSPLMKLKKYIKDLMADGK